MRKDGSEFPVEVVVTRADLPGPPLFCGYLRDVTEAREREARPAPAGRRAGRAAARGDRGRGDDRPAARVRGRHRGGRAPARRAEREHGALRRRRGRRPSSAAGARAACATCRSATTVRMDGDTVSARVYRTRRARPDRQLRRSTASWPRSCAGSASSARSPRRSSSTAACGGTVIVSSVEPDAVPGRRRAADRRLRRAGRAGAGQRPGARGARRLARPDRGRRATPSGGGWSATCTTARSSGSSRWR